MHVPNYYQTVVEIANKYPREFREAHREGPNAELWIKILAYELHKMDPQWGLNGRNGTETLCQDAISYFGIGISHDPVTAKPVMIVDVIQGAGGPDPRPCWLAHSDPNVHAGPGRWIKPLPVPGYHNQPAGPPIPIPPAQSPDVVSKLDDVIQTICALITAVKECTNAVQNAQNEQRENIGFVVEALTNVEIASVRLEDTVQVNTNTMRDRLDEGFTVEAKGNWIVGKIRAAISANKRS